MPVQPSDYKLKVLLRFFSKVRIEANGCWIWTAGYSGWGYGRFSLRGVRIAAHRFVYEEFVGPIPEGKQLDHLCRNHACVNFAHLEPVTVRENVLRGIGLTAVLAKKTHCKNGHLFNSFNTVIEPMKGRLPRRVCRTCRNTRRRERCREDAGPAYRPRFRNRLEYKLNARQS